MKLDEIRALGEQELRTRVTELQEEQFRLRFRHGNKEHMVRVGNRLSIAGIAASAVSLEAVVLLVMDYVLSLEAAIAAAASLFVVVAVLWYGLPLWAELRDRRAR